jgi:hypothetical protein
MDVDAIMISFLSKEEREKHVKEGLCFICHKAGHQSKSCPMRKDKKRSSRGKARRDLKPNVTSEPPKKMGVTPRKKKKTPKKRTLNQQ